jgi:hypothetical protein
VQGSSVSRSVPSTAPDDDVLELRRDGGRLGPVGKPGVNLGSLHNRPFRKALAHGHEHPLHAVVGFGRVQPKCSARQVHLSSCSLLLRSGEEKHCGGWARPDASSSWSRDPEVERPWAHLAPLCQRVGWGSWEVARWLHAAHAALIPSAPLPARGGRIVLEDVCAMVSAERFVMLGYALSPPNPQDRRPSIGSLALPGHPCASLSYSPVQTLEGRSGSPPREELRPYGLLLRGVSPPLPPGATSSGRASALSRGRPAPFPLARTPKRSSRVGARPSFTGARIARSGQPEQRPGHELILHSGCRYHFRGRSRAAPASEGP